MPRPGDDRRRGGGRRRARREQWEVSARALGGVFVMCDEKRDRPSPERSVGAVVGGGGRRAERIRSEYPTHPRLECPLSLPRGWLR